MKKNVMMRLAAILLVCVLASTCGISGTYAKYVTTASGADSARVAKWGVDIEATGNAFHGYYYSQANGNGIHTEYELTTDTVKSEGGDVVAPGTHGGVYTFNLTGQPEVDFRVVYTANFSIGDRWNDGTSYYCPLIIHITKLDGTVHSVYGTSYPSAGAFADAVNKAIADCSFAGKAGTDLATLSVPGSQVSISWEWPFETGATQAEKDANNIRDTYLGDQAATGNAAQIYLGITCTIEQVD